MVGLDLGQRGRWRRKPRRELERRGYQVPEWAPENESPERQADEPEGQVDAPEVEADAPEVEADEPVMPEPETNEPEAADSAGPEPEPEPEPGMV